MNLNKAGGCVSAHQLLTFLHSLFGRQGSPGVWPQVVAAQQNAFAWKIFLFGQLAHVRTEMLRGHAGVAAFLVDLVAGCFDQQRFTR